MTAGFYSPLPPDRTGVADYAAALLPELNRRGDIRVSPAECDIALYQLGNNQLHRAIYARAVREPGVVVLHDAVLQHFFLGSLTREQYIAEFVYNYGEWSRQEAQRLWDQRSGSAQDPRYFARPMLKRIAESSRALVVHNPAAQAMVLRHAPEARVTVIPHLFVEAAAPDPTALFAFRQKLGIPLHAYLFGLFGYLRESKRVLVLLEAFRKLHRLRSQTALLVAGDFVSTDLERAAEPLLRLPGVCRTGHLPDNEFHLASRAVDCCVNLRYPRAGETSGIAIRLLGIGKPLIATGGPEIAGLPPAAFFPVEPGIAEAHQLLQYMMLASEYPDLARDAGRQAALHVRRYHSLTSIGQLYWNVLCDAYSQPR